MIYQFGILYFTNRILHCAKPVLKIVIAALAQSLLFVVITAFTLNKQHLAGAGINLAVSLLISAVLFRADTGRKLFRMILTELVLCILLGGILTLFGTYINNGYLLLTAIGGFVFLGLFVGSIKELFAQTIGRKNSFYKVKIIHKKAEINAKGLLDSGNGLTDPISKEPVCILTNKCCKKLLRGEDIRSQSGYRMIPYHAIGKKNGIMEAFFVEDMEIQKAGKKAEPFFYHKILCAVSPDNFSEQADYELILHPKLFE